VTDERRHPLVVVIISSYFYVDEHRNSAKILLRHPGVTKDSDVREILRPVIEAAKSETNSTLSLDPFLDPFLDPSLLESLKLAPHLTILLDYDGTLVPHFATPEKAAPDQALLELLLALTRRPQTSVNITSGRDKDTLEHWFASVPIGLFAEHGLWARPDPRAAWRPLHSISTDWKECIWPVLENFAHNTPGSILENKSASIAWHYRLVDPEIAPLRVCEVHFCLDELARVLPIDIMSGDNVIEVRMRGVNKGLVLEAFEPKLSDTLILALGDDCTDEDLFAVLPEKSIAIHVGSKPSRARYRLRDFQDARRLLRLILPNQAES